MLWRIHPLRDNTPKLDMFPQSVPGFMVNTSYLRSQPERSRYPYPGPGLPSTSQSLGVIMRRHYHRQLPCTILASFLALQLGLKPLAASAQITRSPPPREARVHTVVPGGRYRASGFKRWLLGSDYRDLWTSPIEVPVLNLDSVGYGLTPLRTGGFGQSVSLHFQGNDGRRYVVRSIDKDPTKRLIPRLKNTFAEDIIQDQISALHPTGALVVDALLEATGILHASHRLVIIPDDPRLGKFRGEFAGLAGMLVLHPDEGGDNTPGFAGSRRIAGSETFFALLEESPCDRVDARAFLKARLLDMLIGDKDRHAGQWRWASFPAGTCRVWLPIPEDRDQAFVHFDGFVNWIARVPRPQQIKFEADFPDIVGLTFNGWEVDRELLAELEKPAWDSLAAVVALELSDSVIDAAVRRLPPTHLLLSGDHLARALKSRRDRLATAADSYYRLISRSVDIKATDLPEYAEFEHRSNGDLRVRIGLTEAGPQRAEPYFHRTFHPYETEEVRLYMRDGDDSVEVTGTSGSIVVRVDGGAGDDRFVNSSMSDARKTRFYDWRGENDFLVGTGAKVDVRPWGRPPARDQAHKFALDWGGRRLAYPLFSYAPDPGLFFAIRFNSENYGYRRDPFRTQHTVIAGLITNGPEPIAGYRGTLRSLWRGIDGKVRIEYTGLDFLRFHGFGNETEVPNHASFYELEQRNALILPTLAIRIGHNRGGREGAGTETLRQGFTFEVGPVLKYSNTPPDKNVDRYIGTIEPELYGTGSFGQIGATSSLEIDTRDNSGHPRRGLFFTAGASLYPRTWDVTSTFGEVHGAASVYLTAQLPTEPTLALRAGGKKVWGTYPFHEAAYVGGGSTLRGFRSQRFAGDAAAFGNVELRVTAWRFKVLVPAVVGLFGLADVARVFHGADPAEADAWHTGLGGGIWLSVIDRLQTLTAGIATGEDLTGLYVRAGFLY